MIFHFILDSQEKDRKKLRKVIDSELKHFNFSSYNPRGNGHLNELRGLHKEMFNRIMSNSYYEWGKTTDNFLRDIAKKSINLPKKNLWSDY